MKPIIASIAASLLLVSLATAHTPRYRLTDLGPVGPGGLPLYISANGIISGAAAASDGSDHAVLWYKRFKVDIARPGLGGANSIAFGVNAFGQAVGGAETGEPDPSRVDFCGFKTYGLPSAGGVCAPFFWQNGVMRKLPTLGGNNGTASQINRWGVAAGEAETALADPDCPERFQFKPVTWHHGRIHELPTLPGDPDAVAYAINDRGQVVGSSGTCAPFNPALQLALHPLHPILWQPDGTAISLGSLGGTGYGVGNLAININNHAHVVGTSDLAGDATAHAFFWRSETGMEDLGTLPGDVGSGAVGINDSDEVVGVSLDASFNLRAFVWHRGEMTDLNLLVPASRLHLMLATSVNARGDIIGLAVDTGTGELHGYLAAPRAQRPEN
jgi:probable HAF family extracellular repeat protein